MGGGGVRAVARITRVGSLDAWGLRLASVDAHDRLPRRPVVAARRGGWARRRPDEPVVGVAARPPGASVAAAPLPCRPRGLRRRGRVRHRDDACLGRSGGPPRRRRRGTGGIAPARGLPTLPLRDPLLEGRRHPRSPVGRGAAPSARPLTRGGRRADRAGGQCAPLRLGTRSVRDRRHVELELAGRLASGGLGDRHRRDRAASRRRCARLAMRRGRRPARAEVLSRWVGQGELSRPRFTRVCGGGRPCSNRSAAACPRRCGGRHPIRSRQRPGRHGDAA